jgi:hypothetical protein
MGNGRASADGSKEKSSKLKGRPSADGGKKAESPSVVSIGANDSGSNDSRLKAEG